jgi:group I intron endonuclease
MACVYIVTHTASGRSYVGLTTQAPGRRWYKHKLTSRSPKYPFQKALAKYGIDSFTWRVVWDGPEARVKLVEQQLIRAGFGHFNCTVGGDGLLGKKHTEETKRKMADSAVARGQKPPPNVGTEAARIVHLGATRPVEWRQNMTQAQRERAGVAHLSEAELKHLRDERRRVYQRARYAAKKAA